ncbi:hypothetical protein ACLOJK_014062 [Asimina triloba]
MSILRVISTAVETPITVTVEAPITTMPRGAIPMSIKRLHIEKVTTLSLITTEKVEVVETTIVVETTTGDMVVALNVRSLHFMAPKLEEAYNAPS